VLDALPEIMQDRGMSTDNAPDAAPEYLTTRELAQLLRIKERKVYDLAASGTVPCSKAMGKLLFPTQAIYAWIEQHSVELESAGDVAPLPNVILGSHDPLLDWALGASECSLASFFDGSADGVERFINAEGVATGLHLYDSGQQSWNTAAMAQCVGLPVVLTQWAVRQRGLIISPANKKKIRSLHDLVGRTVVPRQAQAGAQLLLQDLLKDGEIDSAYIAFAPAARSESEAAVAVLEGSADAAFGLAALAAQYKLAFVPIIEERFDLLVNRRAWFEPPIQALMAFCRTDAFAAKAKTLVGYDITGFGTVHFNG
jgi:excisionase family DNA binding protein